jgi:acyl-CoA synthetase (AMP-forming)/AMP-acid ligase II
MDKGLDAAMTTSYSTDAWSRHGLTVGDLLASRAAAHPARDFITLLSDTQQETVITYGALHAGALRRAAALQALGVRRGDRVVLALPTGAEFLETFFGVLLAGATAVPCYPPARTRGLDAYQENLGRLMAAAAPRVIVTFKRARLVMESTAFRAGLAAPVVDADDLAGDPAALVPVAAAPDDVAIIQFSSGSTAEPKGVLLPHRAVLENLAATIAAIRPRPDDVTCSWLPLYHDMGLIGMVLLPLFSGTRLVLLSPQAFLLDTKRWLWAIHRYRCTLSTAPNFAYQLLASRLKDSELEGLDLSCWRMAYNGAEPVLPATMRAVAERLAPYGFAPEALTPIYGLAEVAVAACFPPARRPYVADRVDPLRLMTEGLAVPAEPANLDAQGPPSGVGTYLSVGHALPGYAVRVAGPDGAALPDRTIGEIQLQGPSVMAGYLNNPEATAAAFQDGWLRTGDLGYRVGPELFVVGRLKDMILKGGRNYAPQDLELAACAVAGIRQGCVAAFGVPNPAAGTESVVLVAETRAPAEDHATLRREVAHRVAEAIGLKPDQVLLVPPGTVPKTSSGKVRRRACRERFLSGDLTPLAEPGLVDQARVFGQAIAHRFIPRPTQETDPHG